MKKLIRLFVNDGPIGGFRIRDARLSAVPVGKVIVNGQLWTGSLLPLIDAIGATFGPSLDTPFATGRTLRAEQLSGVIDLGRAWVGNLASEIRSAAANASAGPTVDVGEVLGAIEKLRTEMNADPVDFPGVTDALRGVRRAADRVGGTRTGDSNPLKRLTMLTPEQRQSGPNSPENARARDFWRSQSAPPSSRPIGDSGSTTAVRDQLAIAARAKDTRTRMEALNAAARAFWARA